MEKTVNVAHAKAHLSELIERAAEGETIILARDGKPRARLVPLEKVKKKKRVPGKGKGRFQLLLPRTANEARKHENELADLFEGNL
jgi:prevent-host-death family protein